MVEYWLEISTLMAEYWLEISEILGLARIWERDVWRLLPCRPQWWLTGEQLVADLHLRWRFGILAGQQTCAAMSLDSLVLPTPVDKLCFMIRPSFLAQSFAGQSEFRIPHTLPCRPCLLYERRLACRACSRGIQHSSIGRINESFS